MRIENMTYNQIINALYEQEDIKALFTKKELKELCPEQLSNLILVVMARNIVK